VRGGIISINGRHKLSIHAAAMPGVMVVLKGTMVMKKFIILPGLILACVFLTGCATGPTYKSTVHSANEGAQVSGSTGGMVGLRAVDGVSLFPGEILTGAKIMVDPGERVLTVRGAYTTLFTDGNVLVELKPMLRAGHAYQLRMARKKSLITLWVEDLATHEPVSERKSANAIVNSHLGFAPGGGFMQF